MNRFASLVLLLVPACNLDAGDRASTGMCPTGEICSDGTPSGLHFDGAGLAGELFVDGPSDTAVGGVQDVQLDYDRGDGQWIPLDQPFAADDQGGAAVKAGAVHGAVVTMEGVNNGSNLIRIVDPTDDTLYDRKMLGAGTIGSVAIVATTFDTFSRAGTVAFWTGKQDIGVALIADTTGHRLVDTGMTLDLAGATRRTWDTLAIETTAAGSHTVAIAAGGRTDLSATFAVVDHVDAIAINPSQQPVQQSSGLACFMAKTGDSWVAGAPWSFTTDNGTLDDSVALLLPNCASLKNAQVGVAHITATAGDATVTFAVDVMADQHAKLAVPMGPTQETRGERARLMR